jgi:hypothetical protein
MQAVGLLKSFEAAFPGALPQAGMRDALGVVLTGATETSKLQGRERAPGHHDEFGKAGLSPTV